MAADEARRLYAAMNELEAANRALLVLHYLQGLSYREMALVLDEPSGTVKWRTSAALNCLRLLLVDEDPDHANPKTATSSDRSLESLETRLRALPGLPVPNDLEARLLAAIPPEISHKMTRRRVPCKFGHEPSGSAQHSPWRPRLYWPCDFGQSRKRDHGHQRGRATC